MTTEDPTRGLEVALEIPGLHRIEAGEDGRIHPSSSSRLTRSIKALSPSGEKQLMNGTCTVLRPVAMSGCPLSDNQYAQRRMTSSSVEWESHCPGSSGSTRTTSTLGVDERARSLS